MSTIFRQQHLRVEVPQTTDGVNLKYKDGKIVKKIVVLPVSAKRKLESTWAKRPKHLRDELKITVVDGDKVMNKKEVKEKIK